MSITLPPEFSPKGVRDYALPVFNFIDFYSDSKSGVNGGFLPNVTEKDTFEFVEVYIEIGRNWIQGKR